MSNKITSLLIASIFFTLAGFAQDPSSLAKIEQNVIQYPENIAPFFHQLDQLSQGTPKDINIVHFGDSHIQAGITPEKVRQKLQRIPYFGDGGRGMTFPYRLAHTNNPSDYKISYTGKWEGARNAVNRHSSNWGVTGITAQTTQVWSTFSIDLNTSEDTKHRADHIRVYYPVNDTTSFEVMIKVGVKILYGEKHPEGYKDFYLERPVTEVEFLLSKAHPNQSQFLLQGIWTENTKINGIVYQSIGVNGAKVSSYLRCKDFVPQLKSLEPDLAIISLGTNDAYDNNFTQASYENNLSRLIDSIRKAKPNCSILLTTPNDALGYKKRFNPHNELATQSLHKIAQEKGCALWDFFAIMGGPKSIHSWISSGLAKKDYIHLTGKGYNYQGDLLFQALIVKAYLGDHQDFTEVEPEPTPTTD